MGLYSRACPPLYPPATLLRPRPPPRDAGRARRGPPAITGFRPPGSRRHHTDVAVANVRRLIEQTALSYAEIAAKTGVSRASIFRWARDGAWVRPLDAPRCSDRMPTARAGRKLKLRLLAERLRMLAEHYVRQLEETPASISTS